MSYTNAEYALIWSVVVTAISCLATVAYLRGPMRGILNDRCQSEDRARFWLAFSNIVVVLLPMICLLSAYVSGGTVESPLVSELAVQVRWSLMGLFLSVICLAVVVASIPTDSRHQISVEDHQVEDLKRLLAKVDEVRARDILKRPNVG
ncbi:MAG: hypothetical protein H7062_15520 [Candidatus Saccharimonas sp.]|nr:hypothetical protein [Planctomycetaceae bacterium]